MAKGADLLEVAGLLGVAVNCWRELPRAAGNSRDMPRAAGNCRIPGTYFLDFDLPGIFRTWDCCWGQKLGLRQDLRMRLGLVREGSGLRLEAGGWGLGTVAVVWLWFGVKAGALTLDFVGLLGMGSLKLRVAANESCFSKK